MTKDVQDLKCLKARKWCPLADMRLVPFLLSVVLLLGPRSGWGCQLPATDQTTCWNSSGSVIPCAGTGEDGDLREGAPLAYVDNGDGTVTDVTTGLMWEKLSHDGTVHDDHNTYTWANAISGHVATLNRTNFAGHNDWRLPNVRELLSIVTYQNLLPTVAPAFDNHCSSGCDVTRCSCTFSGDTWTSTSEADSPSNQWFVDFQDGQVGAGLEHGSGPVRAVRDASTGCSLPATGQTQPERHPVCRHRAGRRAPEGRPARLRRQRERDGHGPEHRARVGEALG